MTHQGPQRLGLPTEAFIKLNMQAIADEDDFFETLCDELGIAACRGGRLQRSLGRGPGHVLRR
ncbi:MAG: hypothetical protein HC884_19240 [Chloroflexaceae bacterium]|nr:hypothetical protein [Chloroflexaceae bacterium]